MTKLPLNKNPYVNLTLLLQPPYKSLLSVASFTLFSTLSFSLVVFLSLLQHPTLFLLKATKNGDHTKFSNNEKVVHQEVNFRNYTLSVSSKSAENGDNNNNNKDKLSNEEKMVCEEVDEQGSMEMESTELWF